jgi:hypothetical protein
MLTSAHLKFLKDHEIRIFRNWIQDQRDDLAAFSQKSDENRRIALNDLGLLENTLKALNSFTVETLNALIAEKEEEERSLDPELFQKLTTALEEAKNYWSLYFLLEGRVSKLYSRARDLVRLSEERLKPSELRLKEYGDPDLNRVELSLLSEEPIYKKLERVLLNSFYKRTLQALGFDHPVAQIFAQTDLDELIEKTQLYDHNIRRELYENFEQIKESQDPMIVFAKALDSYAREARLKKELLFDRIEQESYATLAQIAFGRSGDSLYPDATFTLRLSFGTMKAYEEEGKLLKPMTQFHHLFEKAEKHQFEEPYTLPPRWLHPEVQFTKNTPLNFVSTNDIIGGNSGSPVINQRGELVGLIFDGNIYSNSWYFRYDKRKGRAISVHSQGILTALRDVYGADSLVEELQFERLHF